MAQETDLSSNSSRLASEVRDLRFVIRLTWVLITSGTAFLSFGILEALPEFHKLLVDMLGGIRSFPPSTALLFFWGKLGGGFSAPLILGAVSCVGIGLPWFIRDVRAGVTLSVVCSLLLALHCLLCCAGIAGALWMVIRGLAGSGL
jgi:hypothetical protein